MILNFENRSFVDLTAAELNLLHDRAKQAGWGAAEILLRMRQEGVEVGGAPDSPVTTADLAANAHILQVLQPLCPPDQVAYLTEETFKAQPPSDRLGKSWVWIIDPLDGTKDYLQNTGEYAVQIALTYQGRPVLAVVACPGMGKLYSAIAGAGTRVETQDGGVQSVQVSGKARSQEMILLTSRNHRNARLEALLQQWTLGGSKAVGSVGCKLAAIVEQSADLYISLSGKSAPKDWDFAAPELILTEAGGQISQLDGSPLQYNREDVNQWGGILASNGRCHAELCQFAQLRLKEIDQTP
ncbi:MAG: 3'(2'),5'-bisphosphate nucleotidase CysQ [Synechococcales bacterium]|nr:3'(2'),5'-bisphosphate nucleotidase CysQ [Synechococcales bacterium]